jgi:transcriptional regulator with XRE-family HTH domain
MTIRPRRKHKHDESDFDRLVAQESLILETTEEICRLLEVEDVTRSELATRLGKSKGFVTQVLSGERNMTLNTMADFAFALGHRLHVRAVPASQSSSSLSTPFQTTIPIGWPEFAARGSDLSAATEGWAQAFHRHSEVRSHSTRETVTQWAPATDPVESAEPGTGDPLDHEFALTA